MPRAALDHVVLEVVSPEASLVFYREVLGLAAERAAAFAEGTAPFPSVRVGAGSVIDLFPRPLWRGRRAHNPNHLCLAMTRQSVAAVERRLRRRAIPITQRMSRNFGARGYGTSLYFEDPDGISIEVRWYGDARARRG
jgi:catechol 2,3-dioxygenase-like lactoylglutathione lyase family enzyme